MKPWFVPLNQARWRSDKTGNQVPDTCFRGAEHEKRNKRYKINPAGVCLDLHVFVSMQIQINS